MKAAIVTSVFTFIVSAFAVDWPCPNVNIARDVSLDMVTGRRYLIETLGPRDWHFQDACGTFDITYHNNTYIQRAFGKKRTENATFTVDPKNPGVFSYPSLNVIFGVTYYTPDKDYIAVTTCEQKKNLGLAVSTLKTTSILRRSPVVDERKLADIRSSLQVNGFNRIYVMNHVTQNLNSCNNTKV